MNREQRTVLVISAIGAFLTPFLLSSVNIALPAIARDLKMNAAYLSALFSRVVGIPFKTYLTDLRVQKAKGLLGDCAKTSTEVAFAVGYTSEERFRSVFRKATGLSPKVWRETMRISVPAPGA